MKNISKEKEPKYFPDHIKLEDKTSICENKGNVLAAGSSGSGKTEFFTIPNVLTKIQKGESFVASDPFGEIYRDTASAAEENGYDVKLLNLSSLQASDGWDPLSEDASLIADSLVINEKDQFFALSEKNLLKALVLYVSGKKDFGAIYDVLTEIIIKKYKIPEVEKNDPSRPYWMMFDALGRVKEHIAMGLMSELDFLSPGAIRDVLLHDDIDLSQLRKEKCAYYVICPHFSSKMRPLHDLFLECAVVKAVSEAGDIPVTFFMDGETENRDTKLTRKVSFFATAQSIENADSLYDTYIVLYPADFETANFISKKMGSYNGKKITPEEILEFFGHQPLEDRTFLILRAGEEAVFVKPFDPRTHELYPSEKKEPADHNPKWRES